MSNYQKSNHLSNEWLDFSKEKKIYDQIRLIDENGYEKIRINYNNGNPEIVANSELQNKKHRYYFKDSIKLENQEIFISKFDLNIENEDIDMLIKPMIRFSTPVFDNTGNKKGFIIVNYLAKSIMEQFDNISQNNIGKIFLLNSDSYWLIHKDTNKQWGFMFEEKKHINFKNEFSNAWEKITNNTTGQFYNEKGLFTFSTIFPLALTNPRDYILNYSKITLNEELWKVVSYIPFSEENIYFSNINIWYTIYEQFFKNYYLLSIVTILSFIICFLITSNKMSKDKISFYAAHDMMTDTFNRRAGIELLENEFDTVKKHEKPLTICFIDVNGLKIVNDNFGHEKGDELIKTVVTCIKNSVSVSDFIIRLGGDEFLIAMPNTSYSAAEKIWINISKTISEINDNDGRNYLVSISHGISEYTHNSKITLEQLINEADKKMYIEKNKIKKDFNLLR
ncbi:diguanylate cyclase [Clostridium aestuarii]|uniref:Diguanylate cyclase n=2 Tax=Clostridium aestuarii TaxID=338193 RepID=A0ABT4CVV1_9CLOT|nr:diguanylate cyclase [Clostridium aestuarii]MCY6483099.1 diguanylate cyclase [Clostridium aestuarii]